MSYEDTLARLRADLDDADARLLDVLVCRREVADAVMALKDEAGVPRHDAEREAELITRMLEAARRMGLDEGLAARVLREVLEDSVAKPRKEVGDRRLIRVGGNGTTPVVFGTGVLVVIAGPCSVESYEQTSATANAVMEAGAKLLRGGAFKPRTSPFTFQGLGWRGAEILREVSLETKLPTISEVMDPRDVDRMASLVDCLQIGARNMQNFALLKEVGMARCPVMLKRGAGSKIGELLQAADHITSQGNKDVILCERGIRTFEDATRNTLDLSAVPVLRQRTNLPVVVDPSHAAGVRSLVIPLALAAAALEPDGIMVEVHPNPEAALSDGKQALSPSDFSQLMQRLRS